MAMAGNVTPTKPSYIRFVCDDCHTNTYWYEPDDGMLVCIVCRYIRAHPDMPEPLKRQLRGED